MTKAIIVACIFLVVAAISLYAASKIEDGSKLDYDPYEGEGW